MGKTMFLGSGSTAISWTWAMSPSVLHKSLQITDSTIMGLGIKEKTWYLDKHKYTNRFFFVILVEKMLDLFDTIL